MKFSPQVRLQVRLIFRALFFENNAELGEKGILRQPSGVPSAKSL
jgi:hypothetical protein